MMKVSGVSTRPIRWRDNIYSPFLALRSSRQFLAPPMASAIGGVIYSAGLDHNNHGMNF